MSIMGLSERIRETAKEKYIAPALRSGALRVSLRVRDLMNEFRKEGFAPEKNTPQFCTAIQRTDFLEENGLEIESIDGPRSKRSTTVVVHYRVLPDRRQPVLVHALPQAEHPANDNSERASFSFDREAPWADEGKDRGARGSGGIYPLGALRPGR